jgi:hypothetical protein
VEGYIYFSYDTYEKFSFKKNLDQKKSTIKADECAGFFVEGKTFKVLRGINLKVGIWNLFAEKAFAEMVIEGRVRLYKVYSMVGNANMRNPGGIDVANYILEKNNSGSYVLAHPKKGKFKNEMADFFKNQQDIAGKMENGAYTIKNMESLVKDYNSKF